MIKINNTKAIEITKNKLRVHRDKELKKLDVDFQVALEKGNSTNAIVTQKQAMRDLPAQADGKTNEELLVLLDTYGAR